MANQNQNAAQNQNNAPAAAPTAGPVIDQALLNRIADQNNQLRQQNQALAMKCDELTNIIQQQRVAPAVAPAPIAAPVACTQPAPMQQPNPDELKAQLDFLRDMGIMSPAQSNSTIVSTELDWKDALWIAGGVTAGCLAAWGTVVLISKFMNRG